MGRPREFDETEVLDAAVDCFWEHGYEATSTRELADRMGLTGASLYNAFGDKRTLYRKALDHYIETSFEERVRRLEGRLPPRQAIGAFFAEIIQRSLDDDRRRGCMLVNSALEVAPHDPECRQAGRHEHGIPIRRRPGADAAGCPYRIARRGQDEARARIARRHGPSCAGDARPPGGPWRCGRLMNRFAHGRAPGGPDGIPTRPRE